MAKAHTSRKKPTSRASTSKPTAKRKHKPADHHAKYMKDLVLHLHSLGVDVQQHVDSLHILEEEILEIERESESFIPEADHEQLNHLLENLMVVSETILVFNVILYNHTRPLVNQAYDKIFSKTAQLSHALKLGKNEEGLHLGHPSVLIPQLRTLVDTSLVNETEILKTYPDLLVLLESTLKELTKLEKKWGAKGGDVRIELIRLNHAVRKLIHDDISIFSNEMLSLYEARMEIFDYMITLQKYRGEGVYPNLVKEYRNLVELRRNYLNLYSQHIDELNKLYDQGAKK